MTCDAEKRQIAITLGDLTAETLKLRAEVSAGTVSAPTAIKVATAYAKFVVAKENYDRCANSTVHASALQDVIDRIQPEIERLKTSLEAAGYSGVTEDGAPYSGHAQ